MMKRYLPVLAAGWLASAAVAGPISLLWDNYLSDAPGHDARNALSSERRTLVQDSFVVDDAIFSQPVRVDEIRWIAYRQVGAMIQYNTADLIVLDENFNSVLSLTDAAYTATPLGTQLGLELYEGRADLSSFAGSRELAAGRYFVGSRLVGNFLGRNFAATTGDGAMNGLSFGYTRSPSFASNNWTSVTGIIGIGSTEFAYQVYGAIVPEPASLALLLVGGAALMRARRR